MFVTNPFLTNPHWFPVTMDTPRVAYAFWHSTGDAPERLPRSFAEGLESCVRNSGLTVSLLSYHSQLAGVPTGVIVRDASQLLPWADFARLLLHSRVQHLSDYVRALALARLGGGWIIDGDTIWLKRAPNLSVACPPGLGHWFASQHACRSLRSHDKAAILRHWRRHYLKEPLDFLHVALPMGAQAMSPVIESWLSVTETS